jgi:hypothetical protein
VVALWRARTAEASGDPIITGNSQTLLAGAEEGVAAMKKSAFILCILAGVLAFAVAQAGAGVRQHSAVKTVKVVMHDPGCHWFSVGSTYARTMSVKGPVSLLNFDEAALKIVGNHAVRHTAVGKRLLLGQGTYRITMVGQAPDDNTLTLRVA